MRFDVAPVDRSFISAARQYCDALAKPHGSLGRLESLAAQLCGMQRTLRPSLDHAIVLIFAADHGLSRECVSAYPREVTAQMVRNFLNGGAAINVLARSFGCELLVIDAGVDSDIVSHPSLVCAKIGRGTANVLTGDAMTAEQCEQAVSAGARLARQALDRGVDLLILGEVGIGNTAAAALLLHGLTGWPLERCVGRGTGLDDAGLAHKLDVLTRVVARTPDSPAGDPLELLARWGGFEFAMLTGAMLAAAEHRTPVLIDGFAVSVAAALAIRIAPAVLDYCIFGHVSAEKAHRDLLAELGTSPLLDLQMRLGEATGAMLALPILRAAAALVSEMATLESAGVCGRMA